MVQTFNFFNDALQQLEAVGAYDVVFPFLLIFTITFGILQKIQLFGDESKGSGINMTLSIVMGLLAIRTGFLVSVINVFVPRTATMLIIIFALLLLIGLSTGKTHANMKGVTIVVAFAVAIIGFVWALMAGTGPGWQLPRWMTLDQNNIGLLLVFGMIIFTIIAVIWGSRPKKEDSIWSGLVRGIESEFERK